MSLLERFEAKFIPEPNSGCWLWTAGPYDGKQPTISISGTPELAHRVSWELYRSTIPNGLHVLHKCDMPMCVNPDHLFLGTNLDNMRDRDAKGRVAQGEAHVNAKLTAREAWEVRQLRGYISRRKLAMAYGVSHQTVSSIHYNRSWRNL